MATKGIQTKRNSAVLPSVNPNLVYHAENTQESNIVEELKLRRWSIAAFVLIMSGLAMLVFWNSAMNDVPSELGGVIRTSEPVLRSDPHRQNASVIQEQATSTTSAIIVNTLSTRQPPSSATATATANESTSIEHAFDTLTTSHSPNSYSEVQNPKNKQANQAVQHMTEYSTAALKPNLALNTTTAPTQQKYTKTTNAHMQLLSNNKPDTNSPKPGDIAVIGALLANDKVPSYETNLMNKQKNENGNNHQGNIGQFNRQTETSAPNLSHLTQQNNDLEFNLMQCEALGFFEKQACIWKACENYWGKSEACSTPSSQPNIFNQPR